MADPDEPAAQQLAARIREILRDTRWDPNGDPSVTINDLNRMNEQIWDLVNFDNATAISESPALGEIYAFCAAVHKALDQQHPAQEADRRAMTPAQFIEDVRLQFPGLHRRQRELLADLERAYPPGS